MAGVAATSGFEGVAARPRPGRQLPAGAPLLHRGGHPQHHDDQCREYGDDGQEHKRFSPGMVGIGAGAARIEDEGDPHGGERDDQAAARPSGQLGAGPRGERPARPRVELVPGQPAVHERVLQRVDHVFAVGLGCPEPVAAHRCRVFRSCRHRHLSPLAQCRSSVCKPRWHRRPPRPQRRTGFAGVRPHLAPAWRHGVPGPPGRDCAAVTCERATRRGPGRRRGRGEPGHGRRRRAGRHPGRGRSAPAGAAAACGSAAAPMRWRPRSPGCRVP